MYSTPQGGALTCKIENLQFTQCNAISYTQYQSLMKLQLTIIRLTGKQHHSVTVGHVILWDKILQILIKIKEYTICKIDPSTIKITRPTVICQNHNF